MSQSMFITATDTDAGKTYVSQLILQAANQRGYASIGFKPISAGCDKTEKGLRNSDALCLQQASSMRLDYNEVNPIAFADAVAPHLAAQRNGTVIDMSIVESTYKHLLSKQADLLLTEGAGGWRLPINDNVDAPVYLSDFVVAQDMPVILVVGMQLGCLNHAVLSAQSIIADGANLVGWVANQVDPDMPYYVDNVASLTKLLSCPLLAEVKHAATSIDGAWLEQLIVNRA